MTEPIRLIIGAGERPRGAPAGAEALAISGEKLSVRVVAGLRMPAPFIGREALGPGQKIRIASSCARVPRRMGRRSAARTVSAALRDATSRPEGYSMRSSRQPQVTSGSVTSIAPSP